MHKADPPPSNVGNFKSDMTQRPGGSTVTLATAIHHHYISGSPRIIPLLSNKNRRMTDHRPAKVAPRMEQRSEAATGQCKASGIG